MKGSFSLHTGGGGSTSVKITSYFYFAILYFSSCLWNIDIFRIYIKIYERSLPLIAKVASVWVTKDNTITGGQDTTFMAKFMAMVFRY